MNLLTGEYNNTLDEKGRISFPVKLRSAVNTDALMVTKGLDACLWLFTLEDFEAFRDKLTGNASMMKKKNLQVVRHFVASAQQVEFDKSGRLSIPQTLREYAHLERDCTIPWISNFGELWDTATYGEYQKANEESFREAAEEFNDITF